MRILSLIKSGPTSEKSLILLARLEGFEPGFGSQNPTDASLVFNIRKKASIAYKCLNLKEYNSWEVPQMAAWRLFSAYQRGKFCSILRHRSAEAGE